MEAAPGGGPNPSADWRGTPAAWPVALLLAVTVTTISLQMSLTYGRLAILPRYDDVVYMTSALRLVDRLALGGLMAFLAEIFSGAHHSAPFSALGALGYVTIGRYDVAPYVALALPLFLTYLLIVRRLVQERDPAAMVLAVLIATFPIFQFAAGEFRPDFFWGIFLGYGAFRLIDDWLASETGTERPTKVPWLAALVFALGTILKPKALIASAAMLVGTVLVIVAAATLLALLRRPANGARNWSALRRPLGSALWFAAIVTLIAAPFLAADLANIYRYTVNALIHQRELWGPSLSLIQTALFYPDLLKSTLSYGLPIFVVMAAVSLAGIVVRRDAVGLCRWTAAAGLIAVGYVIPTAPQNKSIFLGAPFYGMVLWALVFGYQELERAFVEAHAAVARRRPLPLLLSPRAALIATLVACTAAGILLRPFSLNAIFSTRAPMQMALEEDRRAILTAALASIEALPRSFMPREPVVFANTVAPLEHDTLTYEALKRGVVVHHRGDMHSTNLPEQLAELSEADMVLLPRADTFGVGRQFKGIEILEDIAEAVSTNPDFIMLDNQVSGIPPRMRIFLKESALVDVEPREGWTDPYNSSAGMVRTMTGGSAALVLRAPMPVAGRMILECRSATSARLELLVDNEPAASTTLGDRLQMTGAPVELEPAAATVVSIRVTTSSNEAAYAVDCTRAFVEPQEPIRAPAP